METKRICSLKVASWRVEVRNVPVDALMHRRMNEKEERCKALERSEKSGTVSPFPAEFGPLVVFVNDPSQPAEAPPTESTSTSTSTLGPWVQMVSLPCRLFLSRCTRRQTSLVREVRVGRDLSPSECTALARRCCLVAPCFIWSLVCTLSRGPELSLALLPRLEEEEPERRQAGTFRTEKQRRT